jgi:hypothetical protein
MILTCLLSFSVINTQIAQSNDKSYAQIVDETLLPYFEALKNGDVASIKHCIAGKMLQRYRVLLDQNKAYPDFLRNYYQGVDFSIAAVQLVGNDILASAIIVFPGNGSVQSGYLLRKCNITDIGTGVTNETWKIIRMIEQK